MEACLFYIVLGYLSGSVLYGYCLPKLFKGVDVRAVSKDGNPGAANAILYGGKALGLLALCCDLLKGFIPVYLAARTLDIYSLWFAPVLIAPVAGHAFPLLDRGKGGKAIAVSFGVLLGLLPDWTPVLTLAFFYVFFSLILVVSPHRYRSIVTFLLFGLCGFYQFESRAVFLGSLGIAVIVVYKHWIKKETGSFSVRLFRRREAREETGSAC